MLPSAIENVVVDATEPRQTPAWRYMPGMKEQRAFNRAFPAVVQRNLAYGDGLAPVPAGHANRRHTRTTYKGKLAFLKYNAAQGSWESA